MPRKTWQPIDTAPKDGTWVLLRGGTDEGEWAYVKQEPFVVGPAVVAHWRDDHEHWAYCFWDGGWRSSYTSPTEWMPIP